MEVSDCHIPAILPSGKKPGTHQIGGLVGPEPDWKSWRREKSLIPCQNSNPVLSSL